MTPRRQQGEPGLELDELPAAARAALEAAISGRSVHVTRAGQPIGSLRFSADVLEGKLLVDSKPSPEPDSTPPPLRSGVTVVATAMRLSRKARRRLSDEFGSDYVVLDLTEAPDSADVLLTNPVSPQLLGILRHQFPHARILITEIEDDELGVSYTGPVSRMLEAGASAYLPPRPIAQVAANVHAYLTSSDRPALESPSTTSARSGVLPTSRTPTGPPSRSISDNDGR